MNFAYFVEYILNSKQHMQLGPDDSVSLPTVYGVNKVHCSYFFKFLIDIKPKTIANFMKVNYDITGSIPFL